MGSSGHIHRRWPARSPARCWWRWRPGSGIGDLVNWLVGFVFESPEHSMRITEIFFSIQGESTHAGKPCVFVRLTGCSLRCVYCDTKYSYAGGREMSLEEVLSTVAGHPARLVEVTGGEPLEQDEVYPLMDSLIARGYTV